jgi:Phytanoyl-CoA dioxygenase (PhyH)
VLPGTHVGATQAAHLPPPTGDVPPSARVITAPAGTLVALHDTVLHCSGRNLSDEPRRAWMPQVAAGAVCHLHGGLAMHAVPLS